MKICILEEITLSSKSCLPEKGSDMNNTGAPIIWTVPLAVSSSCPPRVSSICYTDFKVAAHKRTIEKLLNAPGDSSQIL